VDGAAERPVVGLFGAFDTGEVGEMALRRVIESELGRRRPDIDLIVLAPFGAEHPTPGDEGRPARPLPHSANADPLGLDALIIAGDVLGDDRHWAARYPAPDEAMVDRGVGALALTGALGGRDVAATSIWFAVGVAGGEVDVSGLEGKDVWARDPATQERLGGTAAQSGDPVLLAGRIFSPDVLRRRADLLRLCGALAAGRRVVIDTSSSLPGSSTEHLVEAAVAALRTDPKLSVVVVSLDPTRQPPSHATFRVPGVIAERVHHLPDWAGLDDIAAAVSGSVAAIAASPAGANLAASLGVPVMAIDGGPGHRFDPLIPLLAGDMTSAVHALLDGKHPVDIQTAVETLDGAFAELAQRLPRTAAATRNAIEPDSVISALAILQQRLVDERTALQAELSRVQSELDHLRSSPEHRLARPIREGYRRWQRRRT
jgi:hypothetical protein